MRYADDFVILCRTAEQAEQALAIVRRWTETAGRYAVERKHGAARRGEDQSAVYYSVPRGQWREAGCAQQAGWTPLMIAEGGQYGATVKEFPESAALVRKLMSERGMDPEQYSKAGAKRMAAGRN
jgi:hypothetical protein